MAYLFNSADDTESESKADIFGQPGGAQPQGNAQKNDAIDKGQSTAIPSGGGGGGSAAPAPQNPQAQSAGYNPKVASSAFQNASESIQAPRALGKAEGTLADAQQNLQSKANQYQSGAQEQAKGYDVSRETIQGAVAGNKDAYKSLAERLQKQGPDQYKAFEGLGSEQPSVDYVANTSRLLADEAGPGYSTGKGRFDAALLRRNPEFLQRQQQILANQKKFQEEEAKARDTETQKARDYLTQAYGTATGNIKKELGGMSQQMLEEAKQKEAAEDARRAALDPKELARIDADRIRRQIREDLAGADPMSEQARALKFLGEDVDLSPYVTMNRDTDWRDYITQDVADRYNRVGGLLGSGDVLQAGKGPAAAYSINDPAAYQALMNSIQTKRRAADTADDAELARLQGIAAQRAAGLNKSYEGDARQRAQQELESYLQQLNDQYQGPMHMGYGQVAQEALNQVLQGDEGKRLINDRMGDLSWQDVLSADEVKTLNDLSADRGLMNRYGQSQKDLGPEYNIDALKSLMNRYIAANSGRYTPPEDYT